MWRSSAAPPSSPKSQPVVSAVADASKSRRSWFPFFTHHSTTKSTTPPAVPPSAVVATVPAEQAAHSESDNESQSSLSSGSAPSTIPIGVSTVSLDSQGTPLMAAPPGVVDVVAVVHAPAGGVFQRMRGFLPSLPSMPFVGKKAATAAPSVAAVPAAEAAGTASAVAPSDPVEDEATRKAREKRGELQWEIMSLTFDCHTLTGKIDELPERIDEECSIHDNVCTKTDPKKFCSTPTQHACLGQKTLPQEVTTYQRSATGSEASTTIRNMVSLFLTRMGGVVLTPKGEVRPMLVTEVRDAQALSQKPGWKKSFQRHAIGIYQGVCAAGEGLRSGLLTKKSAATGTVVVSPLSAESLGAMHAAIAPRADLTAAQRQAKADANDEAVACLTKELLTGFDAHPGEVFTLMRCDEASIPSNATSSDPLPQAAATAAKDASAALIIAKRKRRQAQAEVLAAAETCQRLFKTTVQPQMVKLLLPARVVEAIDAAKEAYARRRGEEQARERFAETSSYIWSTDSYAAREQIKTELEAEADTLKTELADHNTALTALDTELGTEGLPADRVQAIQNEIEERRERILELKGSLRSYERRLDMAEVRALHPVPETSERDGVSCSGTVYAQLTELVTQIIIAKAFGRLGCHSYALKELFDALMPLMPESQRRTMMAQAKDYYTLPSRWSFQAREKEKAALLQRWKDLIREFRSTTALAYNDVHEALDDDDYQASIRALDSACWALEDQEPDYKAAAAAKALAEFECHNAILHARAYSQSLRKVEDRRGPTKADAIDAELTRIRERVRRDPTILYDGIDVPVAERRFSHALTTAHPEDGSPVSLMAIIAERLPEPNEGERSLRLDLVRAFSKEIAFVRAFNEDGTECAKNMTAELTFVWALNSVTHKRLAVRTILERAPTRTNILEHPVVVALRRNIERLKAAGSSGILKATTLERELDEFIFSAMIDSTKGSLFIDNASYRTRMALHALFLGDRGLMNAIQHMSLSEQSGGVTTAQVFRDTFAAYFAAAPDLETGLHAASAPAAPVVPSTATENTPDRNPVVRVLYGEIQRLRATHFSGGQMVPADIRALEKAAQIERNLKRFIAANRDLFNACHDETKKSYADLLAAKQALIRAMLLDTDLVESITHYRGATDGHIGLRMAGTFCDADTRIQFDRACVEFLEIVGMSAVASAAAGTAVGASGTALTIATAVGLFIVGGPLAAAAGATATALATVGASKKAARGAGRAVRDGAAAKKRTVERHLMADAPSSLPIPVPAV